CAIALKLCGVRSPTLYARDDVGGGEKYQSAGTVFVPLMVRNPSNASGKLSVALPSPSVCTGPVSGFVHVKSSFEQGVTLRPAYVCVGVTASWNDIVMLRVCPFGVGNGFTEPTHASGSSWTHWFCTQTASANAPPRARQSAVVWHCLSSVLSRNEHALTKRN